MNAVTPCGYTALHCAIKGNLDPKILHRFLEQGLNLNAQTVSGKTPFDVAIVNHQVEWMIALHLRNAVNGIRHPFDLVFEQNMSTVSNSKNLEDVLRCLKDWGVRAPENSIEWWGALVHHVQSPSLWMLLEGMGVNFDAQDLNGNTWIHNLVMVREDLDDFTHIPGVTASTILTKNKEGESPLYLFVSKKSRGQRFPPWLSDIFKTQPSLLDAKEQSDGQTVAFMWIQTAGYANLGMLRLYHLIEPGWTSTKDTMVLIMRDAIESQNARIVQSLIDLGGAALANAPLNSKGCPPFVRATYWLSLHHAGARIDRTCNGVWVAFLTGGARQDVSFGGRTLYEMVCLCGLESRIEWIPGAKFDSSSSLMTGILGNTTRGGTLRHLWSIARLQHLWSALQRIVRVLPLIRCAQRAFKQRYYAPDGQFAKRASLRFDELNKINQ